MNEEDKDFVDRAIKAEARLTDEKFRSRDAAIKLLEDQRGDLRSMMISIVSLILSLLALAWKVIAGH